VVVVVVFLIDTDTNTRSSVAGVKNQQHQAGLLVAVDAFAFVSVGVRRPLDFSNNKQHTRRERCFTVPTTTSSCLQLQRTPSRKSSNNDNTIGDNNENVDVDAVVAGDKDGNNFLSHLARTAFWSGGLGRGHKLELSRPLLSKYTVALAAAAYFWLLGAAGGGIVPVSPAAATTTTTVVSYDQQPEYLSITDRDIEIHANKKLIDYAVGTVNTQFYDNSGGAKFNPSDFYRQWKEIQRKLDDAEHYMQTIKAEGELTTTTIGEAVTTTNNNQMRLDTRDGTVETLKYLVSTLHDPYSKYMTREELRYELKGTHEGFLGTGAYIEVPKENKELTTTATGTSMTGASSSSLPIFNNYHSKNKNKHQLLTNTRVANLPVVTAVAPNSPAERAGLVVGDRIVAVGDRDSFVGYGKDEILRCLEQKWGYGRTTTTSSSSSNKSNDDDNHRYFGVADLTIAKPVYYSAAMVESINNNYNNDNKNINVASSAYDSSNSLRPEREIVSGYRSTKVKLPTKATDDQKSFAISRSSGTTTSSTSLAGAGGNGNEHNNLRGDSVVQYELLTSSSPGAGGIFYAALSSSSVEENKNEIVNDPVAGAKGGDAGVAMVRAVGTPPSTHNVLRETAAAAANDNGSTNDNNNNNNKVGYIRLTRFSKSSTAGYLTAVQALEDEGAQSYVIDLRNNYGGVIQEAMLIASTLIGDPHAILCFLLNARGGFTPVDVESYTVDPRYPGYLLSQEPKSVVLQQVMKEHPTMFRTVRVDDDGSGDGNGGTTNNNANSNNSNQILRGGGKGKRVIADWDPPSSYASIHEQVAKRGIHRYSFVNYNQEDNLSQGVIYSNNNSNNNAAFGSIAPGAISSSSSSSSINSNKNNNNNVLAYRQRQLQQKMMQKDIVLLTNEGTASSAEFFVAALQDNGRSVAVVGTKSFGKGLIQHTFPMPDGGGLKLTIGEFLRPSLRHVTSVFDAGFYDKNTGAFVGGGGIRPDVFCDSKQGIPGNPKADLCVGVALDVLEEQKSATATSLSTRTRARTTGTTAASISTTRTLSGTNTIASIPSSTL